MKNQFTRIAMSMTGSNRFDLSHDVKMSFRMGRIYPTCVMDVVPGDRFRISVENMLRFAPLVSPVMHRVDVTTHYFFVPNRILWPEWERWITGDLSATPPYVTGVDGITTKSLGNYMGLPLGIKPNEQINALPFAAYDKIYDEFYRDQNLQSEKFNELVSGDNTAIYWPKVTGNPSRRAWQHDYFTACLPFAQKGDAVTIPVLNNQSIDVIRKGSGDSTNPMIVRRASDDAALAGNTNSGASGILKADATDVYIDPNGRLEVDFAGEVTDINTLRRAFRLQEWLERNARGGTRYIENILAHFGVKSSDKRLQRPEYIGGDRQKMTISEVLSTAQTYDASGNVPVGQLAGHGISVGGGNRYSYNVEEHGWIIGLINVQPHTAYQQGIPKKFSKNDKLDYLWPTFANIGEQPVLNKEVYAAHTNEDDTFGYIPRYSEYRFENNRVAGDMQSSLDFWHLGRIFGSDPALNSQFIECDPSTRIFAVDDPNEDHIFAHVYNRIQAIRKLPKFGIPTI